MLGPSVEIDDVEGITVLGINPPALTRPRAAQAHDGRLDRRRPCSLLALPAAARRGARDQARPRGARSSSRQERIGRRGRRFRIVKLRTMVEDAEQRAAELARRARTPPGSCSSDDPRSPASAVSCGRRSIDELPQLLNVLQGEMSLVGPRPLPPAVDEQIAAGVGAGSTSRRGSPGLWQVLGRTRIPFEEMVKLDYLYVTNWSLWQDVRLLIRTLPAITLGGRVRTRKGGRLADEDDPHPSELVVLYGRRRA